MLMTCTPDKPQAKILIVDDEQQILVALEDQLEEEFEVFTTDDPDVALDIMQREEQLSVILSDQRMPRLTGHELLARAQEFTDATRILITGFSDLEAVIKAVNEGNIFGYVAKPWEPENLRLLIYRAAEHFQLKQEVLFERNLLHNLLDNIPDAVYFKDPELRYVRANRAYANRLGLKDPAELEGHSSGDFEDWSTGYADENLERAILETRRPIIDRVRQVRDPLGRKYWVSYTKAPIINRETDQIAGLVSVERDVSDRISMENRLRDSEAGLRHAERLARLGHRTWDAEKKRFISWSASIYEFCGLDMQEGGITLDEWLALVHRDDRSQVKQQYDNLPNSQIGFTYQVRLLDGRTVHARELIEPFEEGSKLYFSTVQDVSDLVRQQQELRLFLSITRAIAESTTKEQALQRLLRAVCEIAGWHYGAVWMADDTDQRCQPVSYWHGKTELQTLYQTVSGITCEPGEGIVGRVWQSASREYHMDLNQLRAEEFPYRNLIPETGISQAAYFPVIRTDGQVMAVLEFIAAGDIRVDPAFIEHFSKLTSQLGVTFERMEAVQRVQDSESRFRALAANLPGIVFTWGKCKDGQDKLLYVSPKAKDLLGVEIEHLEFPADFLLADRLHPDDRHLYRDAIRTSLDNESPAECEFRVVRENGEVLWLWAQSLPHRREDGELLFEGLLLDITQRKQAEEEIRYLKLFDPATGLPNRTLLMDRLAQAVDSTKGRKMGVVAFSIDQFGSIVDTLGHDTGDRVIQMFTDRVRETQEESFTLGRVGENDFALLLPEFHSVNDITGHVAQLQTATQSALQIRDQEIHLTLSIGVCVYPDDSTTPADLLSNAGAARERVVRDGGNGYQYFAQEMTQRAIHRLSMTGQLRRALENQEFELFYQPIVQCHSGKIVSAEALIRWRQEPGRWTSPGEFVPILEETGLIVPVGEWVLNEACRHAARLCNNPESGPSHIHVNVSGRQLMRADLIQQLQAAIAHTGVLPQMIELELTESALMESLDKPKEFLEAASAAGFRIAIDDFGTGYSSLGFLRDFPVNTLKIDRVFINAMTTDSQSAALTNAIIMMARGFNMGVVAEGVENEQQLTYLRAYNCDYVQGYYFHRPMPFADFCRLLGA